MGVNDDQTWAARAACASAPPDSLFVRGAAQREARGRCFSCEVRMQCLADALNSRTTFGVWGGLTERERRALLRQYPEVTDWTEWLASDDEAAAELRTPMPPRIITRLRQQQAGLRSS
ncbi:MAG: WhiB family transcriptional regulator [Actinomycetota bacterium]